MRRWGGASTTKSMTGARLFGSRLLDNSLTHFEVGGCTIQYVHARMLMISCVCEHGTCTCAHRIKQLFFDKPVPQPRLGSLRGSDRPGRPLARRADLTGMKVCKRARVCARMPHCFAPVVPRKVGHSFPCEIWNTIVCLIWHEQAMLRSKSGASPRGTFTPRYKERTRCNFNTEGTRSPVPRHFRAFFFLHCRQM